MPLPVIHSYAGYWIYRLTLSEEEKRSWKMAVLFMLLANLADLDYLPGMLVGAPELFHRGITHSLGAAVFSSALVALLLKIFKRFSFIKTLILALAAYFSHLALDYLTGSVQFMFWPFRIAIHPMSMKELYHHSHPLLECNSLEQFCALLVSTTLVLRLFAEAALVYGLSFLIKIFSKSRAMQPGISESPALVASLAIFIFVLTALVVVHSAG